MDTETLQNGMTKWLKESMLSFFLRGNPDGITSPAVLKLHLGSNDTGETWTEIPGATPQVISFAAPTTSSVTGTTFVSNLEAVQYPTAETNWGIIKSVGVFAYNSADEETAEGGYGELLYWGRLLNPINVLQGGVVAFGPNTIRIEIA